MGERKATKQLATCSSSQMSPSFWLQEVDGEVVFAHELVPNTPPTSKLLCIGSRQSNEDDEDNFRRVSEQSSLLRYRTGDSNDLGIDADNKNGAN